MSGKKLTGRRKNSISICYLIDVAPEKFNGGGQMHLANLVRQMQNHKSEIINHIFGGPSSHTVIRFLWILWVVPQVIFYHLFRQRFSLIHAHSLPAMAAGRLLSLILGIPIIVTVHGSNLISLSKFKVQSSKFKVDGIKLFIEKLILTKVKYNVQITVSRNFLNVKNVNKNIVYISNGVDFDKFRKLHIRRGSLRNFNLLFVGRKNDPVKGFKILEESFELVKREISDAKLMVADGSISGGEVIKMYKEADLFVLPSLSEGFPLTLLEAWAAKLPVVATAVGEIPYIVKNGINGYLVAPGKAGFLAEVIIEALKNPGLAKLGENGYNLAKRYTWSSVARKTVKVYNEVLSNDR